MRGRGATVALMSKRSLENFLHSDAVFEAGGVVVVISDAENVPGLVARPARTFT